VFGAGSIFDLADWQDTAMLQASRFFCLGDYLTDGLCPEEETTVEHLFTRVCPPISQVVLGADGAIPFYWSNPAYSWEQGRLRFTPPEDKTPSTPAVRVRWLCAPEAVPQAAVTLQNGDLSYYEMVACPPVRAKWRWQSLTREEADHLRRQLDCPSSHENHPNYATLRDKRGIVLLRDSEKAEYCHLTCPSLRLGEESSVALWDNSTRQAEIFRFENHNWHRTGEVLSPFHQISENIYAVVL
jgi:hypothetical protein